MIKITENYDEWIEYIQFDDQIYYIYNYKII
jgi:hypothetical protein